MFFHLSNIHQIKYANFNQKKKHQSSETNSDDGIRVYASSIEYPESDRKKDDVSFLDADGIHVYSACSDTNYDIQIGSRDFSEIANMVSFIHKNNLLRNGSHKKNKHKMQVSKYNDDIDLYTLQKIDPCKANYNVDHIFEIQCFSYVIATALHNLNDDRGRVLLGKLRERLVIAINIPANLNVTEKHTNLTKMNAFKVCAILDNRVRLRNRNI